MTVTRDYLIRRRDEDLESAKMAGSSIERQAHEALARAFDEAADTLADPGIRRGEGLQDGTD